MSITRIYQHVPLKIASFVNLDEKASHHLVHVLRAKAGEMITVFNGEGGEYTAVIRGFNKKGTAVEILSFLPREVESPLQVQLAQGMARGEKMDFIVQKAVELGVNSIVPLLTERSNIHLDPVRAEKRRQHWQAVVVSACEQSGRNRVPEVLLPVAFSAWLSRVKANCRFVLSLARGEEPRALSAQASIVLLVGPEGGLSETEDAAAVQQGFMPLQLGPRTLRTETAALAALAMFQTRWGDFTTSKPSL